MDKSAHFSWRVVVATEFPMIDAYLDESGVHDGAAACVIGGYFGGRGQWARLEREWRSVLAKYQFPLQDFHAKDLLKTTRHHPMLSDLAGVIERQPKIHPIICGVIVEHFNDLTLEQKRFFTGATTQNGRLVTSGCPGKPYFMPFQNAISRIVDYTPHGSKAYFYFGVNRPFAEYAVCLFDELATNNPLRDFSEQVAPFTFPNAAETPQLQAADLFVHLTYQHMLERLEDGDWKVLPKGLLAKCLANAVVGADFIYHRRETMQEAVEMIRREWGANAI